MKFGFDLPHHMGDFSNFGDFEYVRLNELNNPAFLNKLKEIGKQKQIIVPVKIGDEKSALYDMFEEIKQKSDLFKTYGVDVVVEIVASLTVLRYFVENPSGLLNNARLCYRLPDESYFNCVAFLNHVANFIREGDMISIDARHHDHNGPQLIEEFRALGAAKKSTIVENLPVLVVGLTHPAETKTFRDENVWMHSSSPLILSLQGKRLEKQSLPEMCESPQMGDYLIPKVMVFARDRQHLLKTNIDWFIDNSGA